MLALIKINLKISSTFTISFACNNDDFADMQPEPDASWKMVGYLSDPGDGSGTFTSVDSNKIINLFDNGIFSSNGNICNMLSTDSDSNTEGIYDIQNFTLNAAECDNQTNISIRYQIVGNTMHLFYPCKETCYVKYTKI